MQTCLLKTLRSKAGISLKMIGTVWISFMCAITRAVSFGGFLTAPVPPSPLPFVRQEAFEHQIGYIREFYSHPSTEWVLDRRYPYLSKASSGFFVDQSSSLVLKVLERLKTGPELAGRHSGLEFLQEEDLLPLPPPMGDPPLPDRDQ